MIFNKTITKLWGNLLGKLTVKGSASPIYSNCQPELFIIVCIYSILALYIDSLIATNSIFGRGNLFLFLLGLQLSQHLQYSPFLFLEKNNSIVHLHLEHF